MTKRLGMGRQAPTSLALDADFLEKLKELYCDDYQKAIEVIKRESSWNPDARNQEGENSLGLMQINWDFWGTEPKFR